MTNLMVLHWGQVKREIVIGQGGRGCITPRGGVGFIGALPNGDILYMGVIKKEELKNEQIKCV